MSTIIKAQIEDPRINDIRNSIHQKNDAIPFLLLPVRIETRFMQVQRVPVLSQPGANSASQVMNANVL